MPDSRQLSGTVAIVGAYESPRRDAPRVHPFAIQTECIGEALAQAGLELSDVDGLCTTCGDLAEGGSVEDVIELAEYLGIEPRYVEATDIGGCSFIASAGRAVAAIVTGLADVVVVSYAACPRWWPGDAFDLAAPPVGPAQFETPYGGEIVANYGLFAQRHMDAFGTTSEQLAKVAVACRTNASHNPQAWYREPITVEDVVGSRLIASPLHRLDCCVVTDSGGAVVLTSRERASGCASTPVWIAGFGESVRHTSLSQAGDFLTTPAVGSGRRALAMAGARHEDFDVIQLYDAFTISVVMALEDLGFCAKGDAGRYIDDGHLEGRAGHLFNTDGGGLSSNHPGKRGIFALIEGVRQLRGDAPGVQANDPKLALVHGWGGYFSAAATMVLGV